MGKARHESGSLAVMVSGRTGRLVVRGEFLGHRVNHETMLPPEQLKAAHLVRQELERNLLDAKPGDIVVALTEGMMKFSDAVKLATEHFMKTGSRNMLILKWWERRLGELPLGAIDDALVKGVFDREKDLGETSKTRYSKVLVTTMRMALKKGWIKGLTLSAYRSKPVVRLEYLNLAEIDLVLKWLYVERPWAYLPVLLLMDVGVRPNELLTLMWEKVDDKLGFLVEKVRERSKTRTRRIPFTKRTKAFVDAVPMTRRVGPVVRGPLVSSAFEPHETLAEAFKTACIRVGIKREIHLYDLRHTFAYQLGLAGVDLAELSVLMGHANVQQTMVYRPFLLSRASETMGKI